MAAATRKRRKGGFGTPIAPNPISAVAVRMNICYNTPYI